MPSILFLLLFGASLSLACRPEGEWQEPPKRKVTTKAPTDKELQDIHNGSGYFSPGNTWGGWDPPKNNQSWKLWILKWSTKNRTEMPDVNGSVYNPQTGGGWPPYWKDYGPGIGGVPPPPWAYVPKASDKAEFCFYPPAYGNCKGSVKRFAFNPSRNKCWKFKYSGCGGNENRFMSMNDCIRTCVNATTTDCDNGLIFDFQDIMVDYHEMPENPYREIIKDKRYENKTDSDEMP